MSAVEAFDAVDLIRTKRDRGELSTEQIGWLVDAYTRGYVADEQMSAMTMAIFLNGMTRREIRDMTMAMIASGERMDFSGLGKPTTDKHSTGGVGDKITLPLMPLVASFGVAVPQLSGRGLGHTGGTLDKLESIPGYRIDLTVEEFKSVLRRVGASIIGQTTSLAPADKKIYALRDVTGTIESIPLLASSIMSKKLAEGSAALVLDVKSGDGAFMKNVAGARELAESMVGWLKADGLIRLVKEVPPPIRHKEATIHKLPIDAQRYRELAAFVPSAAQQTPIGGFLTLLPTQEPPEALYLVGIETGVYATADLELLKKLIDQAEAEKGGKRAAAGREVNASFTIAPFALNSPVNALLAIAWRASMNAGGMPTRASIHPARVRPTRRA